MVPHWLQLLKNQIWFRMQEMFLLSDILVILVQISIDILILKLILLPMDKVNSSLNKKNILWERVSFVLLLQTQNMIFLLKMTQPYLPFVFERVPLIRHSFHLWPEKICCPTSSEPFYKEIITRITSCSLQTIILL